MVKRVGSLMKKSAVLMMAFLMVFASFAMAGPQVLYAEDSGDDPNPVIKNTTATAAGTKASSDAPAEVTVGADEEIDVELSDEVELEGLSKDNKYMLLSFLFKDGESDPIETVETTELDIADDGTATVTVTFKNLTQEGKFTIKTELSAWDSETERYEPIDGAVHNADLDMNSETVNITKEEETLTIPVSNTWDDKDNAGNKRPDSVDIKLLANGEETGKTLALNEENEWKGSFEGLPVKDADGNEIEYTIADVQIDNYIATVSGSAEEGFVVENLSRPWFPKTVGSQENLEYGTFTVKKRLEDYLKDDFDSEATFPTSVTFKIDGETYTETINLKDGESHTFDYVIAGTEITFEEIIDNEGDGIKLYASYYINDAVYLIDDTEQEKCVMTKDGNITLEVVLSEVPEGPKGIGGLVLTPKITKIVNGNPAEAATFTFKITGTFKIDADHTDIPPMPEDVSEEGLISIKGAGELPLGDIIIQSPGTYTYEITEVNTGVTGYTYDTSKYVMRLVVEHSEDGPFEIIEGELKKDGVVVEDIIFTNTYTAPPASDGKKSPQTGDESNVALWIMILTLAVGSALFVARKNEK